MAWLFKIIPHPTNLRPSSSQTNPTASRSHARRGSRVLRGAGLSGGVSWRALLSGSPPSAETISSGAGSSTDTEGPRVLHEAGLSGGGVWRAATSIDCDGGRRRGGCRFAESCRAVGTARPLGGWIQSAFFSGGARLASVLGSRKAFLGHSGSREPAGLRARSRAGTVALPEAAPIDVLQA